MTWTLVRTPGPKDRNGVLVLNDFLADDAIEVSFEGYANIQGNLVLIDTPNFKVVQTSIGLRIFVRNS